MKNKLFFSLLLIMSIFLQGCEKNTESEISLLGEWESEYEIMTDGSKNFDNPYALLVFTYSDGFILKENNQGNSVWVNAINGDFEWSKVDDNILMSVAGPENTLSTFEFQIANLTEESMEIYSPKEHRYFLVRK